MAYGIDFRKRVLAYVKEGHTRQETAKLFNISTNTLYTWEKQQREQGHLERKKRVAKSRKLPLEQLKTYVEKNPFGATKDLC